MKAKYLFIVSLLVFALFGCEKSEEEPVNVPTPPAPTEDNQYKIPVVFHVLYNNKNNQNQYIEKDWLPKVLARCNQLYANKINNGDTEKKGLDVNVEFVLATTNPQGNALPEHGVNRVQWATPTMDCQIFMNESNQTNAALLWDLNRYINIFIYTFTTENVLGISHIPYASSTHPLDGLLAGDRYFQNAKTSYPHCVSINNQYIYDIPEDGYYSDSDITATLAHELGHYLGLFHAFGVSEDGNGWETNTDYCDDTPNYERSAYESWLTNYLSTTPENEVRFSEMIKRTSSTGEQFNARNIMDYYVCWSDEFTSDQRKRVRHVLAYSPLVPGLRYDAPSTRAIMDAEIPPIRTIE